MVLNRNLSILVIKIYEPLDVERKNRSEMNLAALMVRGILPTEVVGTIDCVQLPGQTTPLQYEAPLELASYGSPRP
jgi:hypothetical protein